MFSKNKTITKIKKINRSFPIIQEIQKLYNTKYSKIVKNYEKALIKDKYIPIFSIIEEHNKLVLDTARNIIKAYNLPKSLPIFAFFSGSFGYHNNLLHSDYDINFIYPEKYHKWSYYIEKNFLKDFAFAINIPLTATKFHNPTVIYANNMSCKDISIRDFKKYYNNPKNFFTQYLLKKTPYFFNKHFLVFLRKTKNITLKKLLENFVLAIQIKLADRSPQLLEYYLKKNATETFTLGIEKITDNAYFNQFYKKMKNFEIKTEDILYKIKQLKDMVKNGRGAISISQGSNCHLISFSGRYFTLYKNDTQIIVMNIDKIDQAIDKLILSDQDKKVFSDLIKISKEKNYFRTVTDHSSLKSIIKNRLKAGNSLLHYIQLLLKLDLPPRFPALINNQEIAKFIGKKNYQQLVQYINEFMRLKTAVDHQAYSLPQNQGLHNYSINDELIAKIQQNYHYPFKNLVEFSDYLTEYQQQFDSLVIKIINRIEKSYK